MVLYSASIYNLPEICLSRNFRPMIGMLVNGWLTGVILCAVIIGGMLFGRSYFPILEFYGVYILAGSVIGIVTGGIVRYWTVNFFDEIYGNYQHAIHELEEARKQRVELARCRTI